MNFEGRSEDRLNFNIRRSIFSIRHSNSLLPVTIFIPLSYPSDLPCNDQIHAEKLYSHRYPQPS
jgi:hypothetical protein